jgi:hypothetical protein
MKGSVLALTGTTLALALACGALIQQVRTERGRAQAEAALRRQWEDHFRESQRARSAPQAAQPAPPAPAVVPQRNGVVPAPPPGELRSPRSAARAADERFLALLATPEGHAQLLTEEKLSLRRRNFDLAKQLHLTAEQESQLLSVEAEQTLKSQARYARCRLDSSCDVHSLPFDLASQEKPVKELLGPEKFAEYEYYQGTLGLRLTVRELRVRLSAVNDLSDEQADALVTALHDESEQYTAEARAMGRQGLFGFGGVIAIPEETGEPPTDAEVLRSAQEFARRVRERVAGLLTAEQMQKFEEIQEEQLAQAHRALRSWADSRAPAR